MGFVTAWDYGWNIGTDLDIFLCFEGGLLFHFAFFPQCITMASIRFRSFQLSKKVALAISRGSSAGSKSFIVEVEADGITGIGEAAEFEIPVHGEDATRIVNDLEKCISLLKDCHPTQRHLIESKLINAGIGSSTRAAINMALYDWAGKATRQPVWKLLGLEPTPRSDFCYRGDQQPSGSTRSTSQVARDRKNSGDQNQTRIASRSRCG